jgi:hypothetical protein
VIAAHGREAVIPASHDSSIAQDIAVRLSRMISQNMGGSGGVRAGGPEQIVIPVSIGGQHIDKIVLRRQKAGYIKLEGGGGGNR